jgi:hypothetical protein
MRSSFSYQAFETVASFFPLHRMTKILISSAALAFVAIAAAGQQPSPAAPAIDVQTIGPQVGARVPSFTLPDQTGQLRSLEALIGPKGAILVFFRSADW